MSDPFSLFVATPCYGGMATIAYTSSLLALQRSCIEQRVNLQIELGGGDALITRARSLMAARFLASPHSHLLFIDADIGFRPEQVFRLLKADRDIVGGVYPIKRYDWAKAAQAARDGLRDVPAAALGYVVRFLPSPTNSVEVDDDGFGPVAYVGTGFLLIKRGAVQRLVDAHPELRARHSDMSGASMPEATMIFETMVEPETGQYLSEDYAFCRRWRDLGGTIFADFQTRLAHVGHATYEGSLADAQAR